MATLAPVSPLPPLVGITELAERWGISRVAAKKWSDRADFPVPQMLGVMRVWAEADVQAWEDVLRASGEDLPGERPRGPEPRGGR